MSSGVRRGLYVVGWEDRGLYVVGWEEIGAGWGREG